MEKEVTRTALHCLRLVSRRLYCTIPNPKPGMHFGTLKLLQQSGLASLRNMFACQDCLRRRHLSKFGLSLQNLMRKGKGKKFYIPPYCANCGFRQARMDRTCGYRCGNIAYVDGVPWTRCIYCWKGKTGDEVMPACRGLWNSCWKCFDDPGYVPWGCKAWTWRHGVRTYPIKERS